MGFGVIVALVGLAFSIISIRLMSMAENAQVTLGRHRKLLEQNFALAIGARIFAIMLFGKASSIIFASQNMYSEKIVEGATLAMMNTVLLSSKLEKIVTKHSRDAVGKMMAAYYEKRLA